PSGRCSTRIARGGGRSRVQNSVALAVAVAGVTALSAFLVSRRIRPEAAARAITVLAVLSALSTLWVLVLIVSANVVQLRGIAERLSWCSRLAVSHRGGMAPIGALALVALVVTVRSTVRVRRSQRRFRAPEGHADLAIVQSAAPTAYSLPGSP